MSLLFLKPWKILGKIYNPIFYSKKWAIQKLFVKLRTNKTNWYHLKVETPFISKSQSMKIKFLKLSYLSSITTKIKSSPINSNKWKSWNPLILMTLSCLLINRTKEGWKNNCNVCVIPLRIQSKVLQNYELMKANANSAKKYHPLKK